jgi:hypothetical protein
MKMRSDAARLREEAALFSRAALERSEPRD